MTEHPLHSLPRPLALVLGGGASLGAIQAGQLQALADLDLRPDVIVGASVGAINGAFMARRFDADAVLELQGLWKKIAREDVFPTAPAGILRALARKEIGYIASFSGLERLFAAHLPREHESLDVRMVAIGADIATGEKVLLESGDLHMNLLASAAIPGVFAPVEVDGRLLVDGGVVANVPVLPALWLGARSLVVLDPGHACGPTTLPDSKLGYVLHLSMLMIRQQAYGVLAQLPTDVFVVYLPPPCPLKTMPHDFTTSAELIQTGYEAATRFLDALAIDGPGVYGHPHIHRQH